MRISFPLLLRILIVVAVVILLTSLVYFVSGGTTSRGLSDWMVYASFATLGAGTLAGISRVGFKGGDEDEAVADTRLEKLVYEFFRSGSFGLSVTLAGVVCFLAAILIDGLF